MVKTQTLFSFYIFNQLVVLPFSEKTEQVTEKK